jgi:hypothetical protein
MDVNLLINEKKEIKLINSFESIRDELFNLTNPIKRSFNERGRQKKALLNKVNELTFEVEAMMKSISERKDVESIKLFTKRVREIVEEKKKISAQLLNFKDQA